MELGFEPACLTLHYNVIILWVSGLCVCVCVFAFMFCSLFYCGLADYNSILVSDVQSNKFL